MSQISNSSFGFALTALADLSKVHDMKPVQVLQESPRSMVIVCERKGKVNNQLSQKLNFLIKKESQDKEEFVLKTGFKNGYVEKEASCLQKLGVGHPNIVQLIDYFYSGDTVFSVLIEKVPGESVVNLLMTGGAMKETEGALIVGQIGKALSYLHSHNIVHRDVKPDNMIFDRRTGVAKLIDFEFAEEFSPSKKLKGAKGTGLYLAPEVRRGNIFKGPEIDVWSLGVSLFVIVTASFPFTEPQIDAGFPRLAPQQLVNFSLPLRDLFKQTLHLQPSSRPPIEIFETHQWVKRGKRCETLNNLTLKMKNVKFDSQLTN